MTLMVFHEMRHFLQLVAEKLRKTPKHDSLSEKLIVNLIMTGSYVNCNQAKLLFLKILCSVSALE